MSRAARTPRSRSWALIGALSLVAALVAPASTALAEASLPAAPPSKKAVVTTWDHENAVATQEPIAGDQVRRSRFYDATVTPAKGPKTSQQSFVYMSVPRAGNDKIGYTEQDGAEFAADADLTMSWTSFVYTGDVWVDVHLKTGQTISSADQVTIRPTDLGLKKQLVNSSTVRVWVPHSADGFRFSVEFDPQLITSYNDLSGASGTLTTQADGNRAIHTEPQNAMLVFANPAPAADSIPTEADGTIHRPQPGAVTDLNTITEEIVYFGPGTYHMGSQYHAVLPEQVKWVYLAPGAYVKGAFRFLHDPQPSYRVTGLGVLSGEQYVYEADTTNGYQHNVNDNCHVTCVKMLQFESSNEGQTLDLQGITINEPPYHSFVVYAHDEDGTEIGVENFKMTVQNYKQVGAWYWQTDGIELYADGTMKNTFFHANDDVLKLYHSRVTVENTVIWKNENGPVIQWGWVPREIDGVRVTNTDIIHNRMYWKDVKYNTCVFNSSSHYEDMGATDRADTTMTVQNMIFTDTRVEGMVNCAVRIFALSNTENIEIDGLEIEAWNDLDPTSQVSLLKRYTDREGNKVTIGNEMTEGNGLLLHNYTVGGEAILKAGDNWAADELGRLNFDADTWLSWNATSDDQPTGAAPTLTVNGPEDGSIADSREVTFSGTSNAKQVIIRVNGEDTVVRVHKGQWSATVTLPDITNRVVIVATGNSGVMTVDRRTITAYGTAIGSLSDPTGDDHGPGSYTYPTDSAFNPGSMDLTGMTVYRDGDTIRFVTTTAAPITNPWGGNGMSIQRLNIHLSSLDSTTTTALLPGTNTFAAGPWTYAIVADGRYDDARFGSGVYGADLSRVGDITLDVDPSGVIIVSVDASVLDGVDLGTAGYQVSMFSDAEDGEGIGNVRPVYSAECAQGIGCPSFIGPYRIGGGAGEWTDSIPSQDTDTTDSNAIDIISGEASQAEVMDWTKGPVVAPYVRLDLA
ncbi:family 49 glycosyl hydrolase [Aestuariimicrobium ganziense]|uniref:family 49 glycosyl hydrolase n=1 Tax=Aestuariimicrobium ganziense TaxID=2773677 RepID=UPI0019429C48|nr:family 49 glycosyl hydrolase [Aestuariimicrobium ganziense]